MSSQAEEMKRLRAEDEDQIKVLQDNYESVQKENNDIKMQMMEQDAKNVDEANDAAEEEAHEQIQAEAPIEEASEPVVEAVAEPFAEPVAEAE